MAMVKCAANFIVFVDTNSIEDPKYHFANIRIIQFTVQ